MKTKTIEIKQYISPMCLMLDCQISDSFLQTSTGESYNEETTYDGSEGWTLNS